MAWDMFCGFEGEGRHEQGQDPSDLTLSVSAASLCLAPLLAPFSFLFLKVDAVDALKELKLAI
jgi:hypothetical protein